MRLLAFLCPYKGHLYKFKQAWEADLFKAKDTEGNIKEFLFARNDNAYTNENVVKALIEKENLKNEVDKEHYLVNLECKRCGHRISISDRLYLPKHHV